MVLGAPRSGTTWAAAWLDCIHDPLWDHYYEDLDTEVFGGVSCTALAMFPEWVNRHPAPKVILHRPLAEIDISLRTQGLPTITPHIVNNLNKIKGLHVNWKDLFSNPEPIWKHLKESAFDAQRHALLKDVNIQDNWKARQKTSSPEVRRKFAKRGILLPA